jgi:hypothetical protein
VVMLGLVSWMVAAVGIHASLRATTTSKALASTITTMAVLYGYPIFLIRSFLWYGVRDYYTTFVGLPSRLAVAPLVSYWQLSGAWTQATTIGVRFVDDANSIALGLFLMGDSTAGSTAPSCLAIPELPASRAPSTTRSRHCFSPEAGRRRARSGSRGRWRWSS